MRKLGFTLAEVLITLVIIGVIAAMTVPSLMQNTNAQEFRSALKKAISAANQALTLQYALDGTTAADFNDAEALYDGVFAKRMAIMTGDDDDLASWGIENKDDDGQRDVGGDVCHTVFTTNDGIKYCITDDFAGGSDDDDQDRACNTYNTLPCGSEDAPQMYIDVNGDKGPNRATTNAVRPRDIYQAQIYSQKVVPYDKPTQGVMFDKQAKEVSND